MDKAARAIILCLEDKVQKEVARQKSVISMWEILESLYMT